MCEPEDEIEDWESGPFCPHYNNGDCGEICARCGHTCGKHWYGDCIEDDCDCEEFLGFPEEIEAKERFEEVYGGEMKRYDPLPEVLLGQARIELTDEQRKIDLNKWKAQVEQGTPLRTLDGKAVTELEVGMEVLVLTLFGWMKGRARKWLRHWDIEGENSVAIVEWNAVQNCFVSSGAYNKRAAEELQIELEKEDLAQLPEAERQDLLNKLSGSLNENIRESSDRQRFHDEVGRLERKDEE